MLLAPPATAPRLHDDPPPLRVDRLAVGDGHVLHVAQSGRRDGPAAVVLHGGPGSGCSPLLRRFFDPARWRIVCVDQRGAGLSTPRGAMADNETRHLLADLRQVQAHLGIERWLVVGGSWGATLAIAHAADVPQAIAGLLLRGSVLARPGDIDAFFAGGTPLAARAEALASDDPARRRSAALDWWRHEATRAQTAFTGAAPDGAALEALVDRYRVQAHYLLHGCWLRRPSLLELAARVPAVPTLLLHGREDAVCPPDGALALHHALPGSRLQWIDGAGHDPAHPAMSAAMLDALAGFERDGDFEGAA